MRQSHTARYQIIREVAGGDHGVVYVAWDTVISQTVALKVVHPHLARDPAYAARFQRDAQLAISIGHPNVVRIHEVGLERGNHFVTTEYLPQSVHSLLGDQGGLPLSLAVHIAGQAALGLEAARTRGLIHRDIKPHNILLSADLTAKVGDFGLSQGEDISTSAVPGTVMVTPHYRSPEQCRDPRAGVDTRSDIYSLGVVLYEMLSGAVPFMGNTSQVVMRQHQESIPTPVEELRPETPAELAAIVARCLEKDPDLRYQTPLELAEALGQVPLPHRMVASIKISPDAFNLEEGDEVQLRATVKDSLGETLSDRAVTWASDSPEDAPVSTTGLVRALSAGAARVTATCEGHKGDVTVRVVHGPVVAVEVSPVFVELVAGSQVQLDVTRKDAAGHVVDDQAITLLVTTLKWRTSRTAGW